MKKGKVGVIVVEVKPMVCSWATCPQSEAYNDKCGKGGQTN